MLALVEVLLIRSTYPANACVLENDGVQCWNVEYRENGDESCHDGVEEKLVSPDVVHPLGQVLLRAGLHMEE